MTTVMKILKCMKWIKKSMAVKRIVIVCYDYSEYIYENFVEKVEDND